MVGFKFSFVTVLLIFLITGCVPQAKKASCGSDEAYNTSLRTCVPVTPDPGEAIKIISYLPATDLVVQYNSTSPITFSVTIQNPYSSSFSLRWTRSYNGSLFSLASGTMQAINITPNTIAQVGLHVIQVDVLNSSNQVVTSKSWNLNLSSSPTPYLHNPNPSSSGIAIPMTPVSGATAFSINAKNNNAVLTASNHPRIEWRVDNVTVQSTTLVSTALAADDVYTFSFDPALYSLGNHGLSAVFIDDNQTYFSTSWSITIAHPPKQKVTARDLYSAFTTPVFSTAVNAYHGTAYTAAAATTYNFVPQGGTHGQANFCVTFASGDGAYTTDTQYIKVDYYLDNVTLIYSTRTSALDNQVCLSDAAAATLDAVLFSNTPNTATQSHTIVARVYDEAYGADPAVQEYATSDLNGGLSTYPITWNINVMPQNTAPTVSFGTSTGLSCGVVSGTTQSSCSVTSDTNFTVSLNLVSDDFYSIPADEANFDYTIRLFKNGTMIQQCTKSVAGFDGTQDTTGSNYQCTFRIESFDALGPFDVSAQNYQIQAQITDNGSPIGGAAASSDLLTWDLSPSSSVTEKNTAPTITSWITPNTAEGSVMTFTADIEDLERDNHTYIIEYCLDSGCTSFDTLTSGTITRTTDALSYALAVNYTLPEDFLFRFPLLGHDDLARGVAGTVKFRLTVTDVPNRVTPLTTLSSNSSASITNTNPAPTFDTLFSSPNPATFLSQFVMGGLPLSITNIPALVLTDTSAVTIEKTYRYQWWVKNATGLWTAIDGANGSSLVWSPSLYAAGGTVSLKLCIEDQPSSVVATPNTTNSVCNTTPWTVTVRNNIMLMQDLSAAPISTQLAETSSDSGKEMAVWYSTPETLTDTVTKASAAYTAMIGNDNKIYVKRVLVQNDGQIVPDASTNIVSFDAFPGGAVTSEVKDISITGSSTGDSLYVAYLASKNTAPFSMYPQVRRLDISAGKISTNTYTRKVGFDYDGINVDVSSTDAGEVIVTSGTSTTVKFDPVGGTTGDVVITTAQGAITVSFAAYPNPAGTICSTCADTSMASQLAGIINSSTNVALMGLTATVSTDTVTISGDAPNDYYDGSAGANSRLADQVGKIYVSGGNWYLPFINSTLGSTYNDKISFYRGSEDVNIGNSASIDEPTSFASMATMSSATRFDNVLVGSDLYIALVSKVGSAGKLYKLDPSTYTVNDSNTTTVFASKVLYDIQLDASASFVYLGVETNSSTYLLGMYDVNLDMKSEFDMADSAHSDTATANLFNYTNIGSYKIVAYDYEARIVASSNGSGSSYLYMARLKDDTGVGTGNWSLSCGYCQILSNYAQFVGPAVQLDAAPIRVKVAGNTNYQLSSAGAIANEGIKDVMFVGFAQMDSMTTPTMINPTLGVFNVQSEQIGATYNHVGGSGEEDAGLFRAPLVVD